MVGRWSWEVLIGPDGSRSAPTRVSKRLSLKSPRGPWLKPYLNADAFVPGPFVFASTGEVQSSLPVEHAVLHLALILGVGGEGVGPCPFQPGGSPERVRHPFYTSPTTQAPMRPVQLGASSLCKGAIAFALPPPRNHHISNVRGVVNDALLIGPINRQG